MEKIKKAGIILAVIFVAGICAGYQICNYVSEQVTAQIEAEK